MKRAALSAILLLVLSACAAPAPGETAALPGELPSVPAPAGPAAVSEPSMSASATVATDSGSSSDQSDEENPARRYQVSPRHEMKDPFTGLNAKQALRQSDRVIAREQRAKERRKAQRLAAKKAERASRQQAAARQGGGVVFGDSVALGAESCLNRLGYSVVAEVGRSFEEGFAAMRTASAIPDNVVVHLGTNGPFSEARFHDVMALLGSARHVTWVTIALPPKSQYTFRDTQNTLIRRAAAQYDNTSIAEWGSQSQAHWFYEDDIHINGSGCEGFAAMVDAAVRTG